MLDIKWIAVLTALVAVGTGLAIGGFIVDIFQGRDIKNLKEHVHCLENPYGASSVAVERLGSGKIRVIQPVTKTDCLHPK